MPGVRHIHLVGNGINIIDASGEDMLSSLVSRLRDAGYDISMSGLNDNVLDVMRRTGLYDKIGDDHFFFSVGMAVEALYEKTHRGSSETVCPLRQTVFKKPAETPPPTTAPAPVQKSSSAITPNPHPAEQ
jgi:hypothetical protein